MIDTKKIRIVALLSATTLFGTFAIAANVVTVSGESFKQIGKDAFWVASVSCDDESSADILRHADSDSWCPEGSDSLCTEDKTQAANNACSSGYKAQAESLAQEKVAAARKAAQARAQQQAQAQQANLAAQAKIKEEISIKEELMTIEEKRLNLTKEELELDRRITEINEILETEDEEDEI